MEAMNLDAVVPHQAHVAEGAGQPPRIIVLASGAVHHRQAGVHKHPYGDARLGVKHLEEEFLEPQIRAPVDGAEVVALIVVAMIEKLLAGTGEAGETVAAYQTGEGLLPLQAE